MHKTSRANQTEIRVCSPQIRCVFMGPTSEMTDFVRQ